MGRKSVLKRLWDALCPVTRQVRRGQFMVEALENRQFLDANIANPAYAAEMDVALDSSGREHMAFYDSVNGTLGYGKRNDSGGIDYEWIDGQSTYVVGQECQIALPTNGNGNDVSIVYRIVGNGVDALRCKSKVNGVWQPTYTVVDYAQGRHPSIVYDCNNYPTVTYKTPYLGQSALRLSRYYSGVWYSANLDSGSNMGDFSSVARLGSTTLLGVSYWDGSNIRYIYESSYGTFTLPQVVAAGVTTGHRTSLAFSTSLVPRILYNAQNALYTNPQIAYFSDQDWQWHIAGQYLIGSAAAYGDMNLLIGSNNLVNCVYGDASGYVRITQQPNTTEPWNINGWSNAALATGGGATTAAAISGTTVSYAYNAGAGLIVNRFPNSAPSGADKTITMLEDGTYTFSRSDFGFSDPYNNPPNSLLAVKITTLPSAGSLRLNGTAVTAGSFISATDLDLGRLTFSPAANANGTGYASFTFQVQDNGGGTDLDPTPNTITFNVTAVNDAPSGTDKTVSCNEDSAYWFSAPDFGFSDPNDLAANGLKGVYITHVPTAGVLRHNGQVVTDGHFVPAADISSINSSRLIFAPDANASGAPYTTFTFQVQDDGGVINGGIDVDPSPNTITINVNTLNDLPKLSAPPCVILKKNAPEQTIRLLGVTAVESGQTVSIDPPTTSDSSKFSSGPTLDYAPGSSEGTLTFTPASNAVGSVTITLTLHETGGASANVKILVALLDDSGQVDASDAINAAINSLLVRNQNNATRMDTPIGGTISLPAGTYLISNPIQIWSGITLTGEQNASGEPVTTVIYRSDGEATTDSAILLVPYPQTDGSGSVVSTDPHADRVAVRNLIIETQDAQGGDADESYGICAWDVGVRSSSFDNLVISSGNWGIYLRLYSQNDSFGSIQFTDFGSGAISVDGNTNRLQNLSTSGNARDQFSTQAIDGIVHLGGQSNSISDCIIGAGVPTDKPTTAYCITDRGDPGALGSEDPQCLLWRNNRLSFAPWTKPDMTESEKYAYRFEATNYTALTFDRADMDTLNNLDADHLAYFGYAMGFSIRQLEDGKQDCIVTDAYSAVGIETLVPTAPQAPSLPGMDIYVPSYVSVLDYGAIPTMNDGRDDPAMDDDTAAIQNAINAAALQGKAVYLPRGKYLTSAPLQVPAGVLLIGEGLGTLIYNIDANTTDAAIQLTGDGAGVRNLKLFTWYARGVAAGTIDAPDLRDLTISAGDWGIYLPSVTNAKIHNILEWTMGGGAAYVNGSDNLIEGIDTETAWLFYDQSFTTGPRPWFTANQGVLHVSGGQEDGHENVVRGCIIEGGYRAIAYSISDHAIWENNYQEACGVLTTGSPIQYVVYQFEGAHVDIDVLQGLNTRNKAVFSNSTATIHTLSISYDEHLPSGYATTGATLADSVTSNNSSLTIQELIVGYRTDHDGATVHGIYMFGKDRNATADNAYVVVDPGSIPLHGSLLSIGGNPTPANSATSVSTTADLTWTSLDGNGQTFYYTVYFAKDDSTPDTIIKDNTVGTTADPGNLLSGSHYYWKVKADDHYGTVLWSPVWDFYTLS